MLTVNATDHPVMKNFHKPEDEKRMVVILAEGQYEEWLYAPAAESMEYMLQYPAERLVAEAK